MIDPVLGLTLFGVPIQYISDYNIAILTLATIFFSLSNLCDDIRRKYDILGCRRNNLEIPENSNSDPGKADELDTYFRNRVRELSKLVQKMGLLFRQSIYLSTMAFVLLMIYSTNTIGIWIVNSTHIALAIMILLIISTWCLLLNVHNFKYIYHFDIVKHSEDYQRMLNARKDGESFTILGDMMIDYSNQENVKIGMIERLKALIPKSPYETNKKMKAQSKK
jgi:hypothetical protein